MGLFQHRDAESDCRFIEIEGLPPDETMTNERQLAHFCERLAVIAHRKPAKASCWAQAFDALDRAVGKTKAIVFLDEISWMGGYDPGFADFLKNAWDTQLSKHPRLIVVLVCNVSAWIQQNILTSRGFVGRISLGLQLPELNLADSRRFWGEHSDRLSSRDFADILSVTGGVPKYLQKINPSLSSDENVRQQLFAPEGALFNDFDAIFSDVLGTGSAAKRRLLDNFTRFYLKYVAPEAIKQGLYRFTALDRLPTSDARRPPSPESRSTS